jgi:1-acyl-sn-glycerol-3-phosphate acyltransferase
MWDDVLSDGTLKRRRPIEWWNRLRIRINTFDPRPLYTAIIHTLVRLLYRIDYKGMRHIPKTGGAILICNHVSYMDGLIINAGAGRPVRYIIDEDIYNLPGVHYFMQLNNAVPIAPRRESVERALDVVAEGLRRGDLFCIFPEGQITYTGNLTRFRFGIEWMLKRVPVPVIPMALSGLWGSVFSRKGRGSILRFIPRSFRRHVTLRCGKPMDGTQINVSHMQHVIMQLMNHEL